MNYTPKTALVEIIELENAKGTLECIIEMLDELVTVSSMLEKGELTPPQQSAILHLMQSHAHCMQNYAHDEYANLTAMIKGGLK